MSQRDDDSFRPKLGSPRGKGTGRFVSRVIREMSKSGHVPKGKLSAGRTRAGGKSGRGRVAARLARRHLSSRSRRVSVKVRLVNLAKAGKRSTATHLRYLEREGVTPDGERGQAYGPAADTVSVKEFERRGQGDRHQFRIIVSPEDGVELQDLKAYTRSLLSQMERDLGTRLEWIAVDHFDTEHPHTHVVLRGKDQAGKDLIIAREYIAHGMRSRASELATEWLGPRTQHEIEASTEREVTQERWTGLDVTLHRELVAGVIDTHDLAHDLTAHRRAAVLGRLNHLASMGLTEKLRPGVWRVAPEAPKVLRSMGERGDIIRTMQRALGPSRGHQIFDPATSPSVTGRVAAKGLHDELTDRGYVIVDGLDGRAHYAALPVDTDLRSFPVGAIVELRSVATRSADRAIAAVAEQGIYRTDSQALALRAKGVSDPEPTIQAQVRRLEALRRARIVERVSEGVWRIPANLPERGLAYDLRHLGGADVRMRCPLPLDQQVRALGATWLDQHLLRGTTAWPATSFGTEVRQALRQREDFLVEQQLAQRVGQRVILMQNLLGTLREREMAGAIQRLEIETRLLHRPTLDGVRVSGTYRQSIQLVSGRFAVLDDGVGFSLVPWRPVIEKRLGQELGAVIEGARVSWELGRSRSLSL